MAVSSATWLCRGRRVGQNEVEHGGPAGGGDGCCRASRCACAAAPTLHRPILPARHPRHSVTRAAHLQHAREAGALVRGGAAKVHGARDVGGAAVKLRRWVVGIGRRNTCVGRSSEVRWCTAAAAAAAAAGRGRLGTAGRAIRRPSVRPAHPPTHPPTPAHLRAAVQQQQRGGVHGAAGAGLRAVVDDGAVGARACGEQAGGARQEGVKGRDGGAVGARACRGADGWMGGPAACGALRPGQAGRTSCLHCTAGARLPSAAPRRGAPPRRRPPPPPCTRDGRERRLHKAGLGGAPRRQLLINLHLGQGAACMGRQGGG